MITVPISIRGRGGLGGASSAPARWLHELIADPMVTIEIITKRESCSVRKIDMTISLAFLAPDLVKARALISIGTRLLPAYSC